MKIFYAGYGFNHGDPKQGRSFEYENFYLSLKRFPKAVVNEFPFERISELGGGNIGRKKFNAEILMTAEREAPDLFFFFPYSDELESRTLEELKKHTTTLAWFADDSWRFYNYSKSWAQHFSWAVTTYSWMPSLYRQAGQPNVIRSQWAVDPERYRPVAARSTGPDVAFVGGWTRPRQKIISGLAAHGIKVAAYGAGWNGGRISQDEMLRVFSSAKINLALNPPPGCWNINSLGRLVARPSVGGVAPDLHVARNIQSWFHREIPQIKARHFEIPACGGFMLTGRADDLDQFYAPGKEIVIYENLDDMVEKITYYLAHDAEREVIARAGYERTIREHTYGNRFEAIFKEMGLG